jgi:hypothetical protein
VSLRLRLCEVLLTLLRAEVLLAAPPEAQYAAVAATLAAGLRVAAWTVLASCCAEMIGPSVGRREPTTRGDHRLLRDLVRQTLDLSARIWAARNLVSSLGEQVCLQAADEGTLEATTAAPNLQTHQQQRRSATSFLLLRPSQYARLALDRGRFQLAEAIVVAFGLGSGAVALCRAAARMHGIASGATTWPGPGPGPLAAVDRALLLGLLPDVEREDGESAVVAALRWRLAELHAECRASGRDARQVLMSALTPYEAAHLRNWSAEGSKAPALEPGGGGGPRALQQQLERLLEQLTRQSQGQGTLSEARVSYLAALVRHLQTAESALESASAELGAARYGLRPAVSDALAQLIVPQPDEAAALARAWGLDLRRVAASAFHKALEMGAARLAVLDALAAFERKYLPPGPLWGVPGRAPRELVAPFAALAEMSLHAPSPGSELGAYYVALMARAAALVGRAWDDCDDHPVARFCALQKPSSSSTNGDAAAATPEPPHLGLSSPGQATEPAAAANGVDSAPCSDPAADAGLSAETPAVAAGEPLSSLVWSSPPRNCERESQRCEDAAAEPSEPVPAQAGAVAQAASPPAAGDAAADQLLRAAGLSSGQAAELLPILSAAFDELPAPQRVLGIARLRRDLRARARDPAHAAHAVGLLQALDFCDAWRAALRRGLDGARPAAATPHDAGG